MIARAAAGQRIGAALLNWASLRTEATGRTWIRLDAWATNTRLQNYYIRHGWTHVRTVHLPHRGSGALSQRRAGTTTPAAPEILEAGESQVDRREQSVDGDGGHEAHARALDIADSHRA